MLRFRWKHLLIPAVLCGVLAVAPNDTFGQRGGFGPPGGGGPPGEGFGGGDRGSSRGFGGRGMGGFDPSAMADSSFNRLQQSYGGSGDSLDYSKIPANVRQTTDMMSQRFGGQPMPATGTVSRQQYRAEMEQRMTAMRSRFGQPGGPTSPAAPTPAPGSTGVTVKMIGPDGGGQPMMVTSPGMSGQPNGFTPSPGGLPGGSPSGFGGPGGGFDPDSLFRQMDVSPADGKLTREEVANSRMGRRLSESFDQNDTNRDGSISLDEYKVYIAARMSGGGDRGSGFSRGGDPGQQGWSGGGSPGWGGGYGPGGPAEGRREEVEEERPVVFRYGKLPQGLPGWFTSADFDKDGQVGLYEWAKQDGYNTEARLAEFKSYDLNGDGLITSEEYLRANGMTAVAATGNGNGRDRGRDPSAFRGSGEMPPNPSVGGGPAMGGPPQFGPGGQGGFSRGDRSQYGDRGSNSGDRPPQTGDGNAPPTDKSERKEQKREERSSQTGGDRGSSDRGNGGDRGNSTGGRDRGGRSGSGGPGGNPFNPGR